MQLFGLFELPSVVTDNPAAVSIVLVMGGILLSLLVEHLAHTLDHGRYRWERRLRARLGIADGQSIQELKWLTLSYQFVLWPFIGFLLLHVWGRHELGEQFSEVLIGQGFKVGGAHIVPAHVLMGILWFVLLLTFGRWLKKKLEQDWLPLGRMDAGLRVSISTLFGYITFIFSGMVGLSVAGLDLSKLAIVAGALSVGIGFGLQNIFNNFASGLILLFERPVRLGDYIKTGGAEGTVRRIRIRSTEIETPNRTTIIMPNSELVSKAVENATYHDITGRLVLPVVVAFGNDPEKVKALLLEVTAGEPGLIHSKEPYGLPDPLVCFTGFDTALRFEFRGYVRDMGSTDTIASRLRFLIFSGFQAAGIQILPSGPQDIHITNWAPAPTMPALPSNA